MQVRLELTFQQGLETLWEAWTLPAKISGWFGSDPEGKVLEANLDVRPNGRYSISFQDSNGDIHTAKGRYLKVDPRNSLSFTWEWESEPGHLSRVYLQFEPSETGTTLKFEHTNLDAD